MAQFGTVFQSLTAPDVALLCAAVLLLLGASSLQALRSPDPVVRRLVRVGYLTALSAGLSVAVIVSVLDLPDRFSSLLLVGIVAATLVARFRARSPHVWVAPPLGDFGMTSAFMLAFSATAALLTFAGFHFS
jgi:hypothetical protein